VSQTSIRKAAVLLSSLPRHQADALVARLDRRQANSVLAEINKGDTVSAVEQAAVILEFTSAERVRTDPGAGEGVTLAMHGPAVRAASAKRRNAIDAGPLALLREVPAQILAAILADERPQTIALVTSHVPSAYGAALISLMPPEQQLAVIRAVAAMEPTETDVVLDVAQVLKRQVPGMAA
jgi:flagellar motor switch protein FliG